MSKVLILKSIRIRSHAWNTVSETLLNDNNFERSTHVRKNLDYLFKGYRHILTDERKQCKQTSLKDYFSKK